MSKFTKLMVIALSLVITAAAWGMLATMGTRLTAEQEQILARAQYYISRSDYGRAIPALHEALALSPGNDPNILYQIAAVHSAAGNYGQHRAVIQILIDERILPSGVSLAELYLKALYFDRDNRNMRDVIALARQGAEVTGDRRLIDYYEEYRYAIVPRRGLYQEAGVIFGGTAPVKQNDLWGFVNARGATMMNPQFDLATRFVGNYAVVQTGNYLRIINRGGARQAHVLDNAFWARSIAQFNGTNFAIAIYGDSEYTFASRSNLDIIIPTTDTFRFIGLPTDGIRALQREDGVWRITDNSDRTPNITSDFIYDSIAVDELGRAAVGGRLFIKTNGQYHMIDYAGSIIGESFDEAHPFFEAGGLAAVRRGELWGFVNINGELVIDFIFDNARSSSFGLAPVNIDGLWGYITVEDYPEHLRESFFGRIVIEAQFADAKQFVNGVAPVMNESGWIYIALIAHE